MKALIDTSIIIDLIEKREPFADEAYTLFKELAKGSFVGYTTSKSVADIYYLVHHSTHDKEETSKTIVKLLSLLEVIDLNKEDVFNAFSSKMNDYEDALLVESASRHHLDYIITRNTKDFASNQLPSLSVKEFLSLLNNQKQNT